jgi:hypothetical protein
MADHHPMMLSGKIHEILYEATARRESGSLIRVDGWCGYDRSVDYAKFSFVYAPEFADVIIYSKYKLEYVEDKVLRKECCRGVTLSNPLYFEDIAEMTTMAPCIKTAFSRTIIYLRPLIETILGENQLNQLILPVERFAYYRRGDI